MLLIQGLDYESIPQFLAWRGKDKYLRQVLEREIAHHNEGIGAIFIAKVGADIVGTAQFLPHHRDRDDGEVTGYLQALEIDPDYRQRGIGTQLIKAVEQEAIHRGFKHLTIMVEPNNNPALNLYLKMGFEIFKRSTDSWQEEEYSVFCLIKKIFEISNV